MIKILLAQIELNCDIDKNFLNIIKILENNRADIIVFPELALTSYCLEKRYSKKVIKKYINEIQNFLKDDNMLIIGSGWYQDKNYYNSAIIINKDTIEFYFKNSLTDYDKKFFKSGNGIKVIKYKNLKLGFLICRDQNNLDLIKQYRDQKIDILFILSAHYYTSREAIKKLDKNISFPIIRAIDTNAMVFKVNSVGKLKNKISYGSSMIVDKSGTVLRQAGKFSEEIIQFTIKEGV